MADKRKVAIAYIFAFVSVFFFFLGYTFLSGYVNNKANEEILPQAQAMNATISALSSISNWAEIILVLTIATIVIAVILSTMSSFAMRSAFK